MPDPSLDLRIWLELLGRAAQSLSSFPLAETQPAERPKCLGLGERLCRRWQRAIRRTVGVTEVQPQGHAAYDHERAFVQRAVVRAAERDQILGVVTAAVGARLQMVNINERAVRTPWHSAAVPVSPEHTTPHRWRDVLRSALRT